jgi:hypothetical protein
VEDKDTCPKRVVETATFKATRPGQAPFEIKTAGGLVVHSGTASFEREGMGYVAKSVRPNLMMNAFDSDMMADVKNSPANSGWVRLKIDCLDALSGKLTLKNLGTTSCQGEALVAIHTNGAGELPYELECGPGRSWQRSVEAHANKIGVDKVRFDVANKETVTCLLRTRVGGRPKPLDGTSMTFQCHRPSGVGAADALVPETRPDPAGPRAPGFLSDPPRPPRTAIDPPRPSDDDGPRPERIVDPPRPKISCAGGTIRYGRCLCPRTHRAVEAGKNAWRCVKAVIVDPPRKLQVKGTAARKASKATGAKRKGRGSAR